MKVDPHADHYKLWEYIVIIILLLAMFFSFDIPPKTAEILSESAITQPLPNEITIELPPDKLQPVFDAGPESIHEFILDVCENTDMDPTLIEAVIAIESNWDPTATSKRGAIGLMQIMPKYWDFYVQYDQELYTLYQLDPNDRTDPKTNILTGINALRYWLSQKETLADALACYNGGNYPTKVSRGYARDVINKMKRQ